MYRFPELPYEIIDFHVHPFLDAGTDSNFFKRDYPSTPEDFVADLKRVGISRCAGGIFRRGNYDSFAEVHQLNLDVLAFRDRVGSDFFIPGINIHPRFVQESCAELVDMREKHDVRLLGELVHYAMDYPADYSIEGMLEILDCARSMDYIVSMHPGDREGMSRVLAAFPDLKIVIAHPGAGREDFEDRLYLLRKHSNAYLDLSGSGLFRYKLLRYGIDQVGMERFIFGSDYPICGAGMLVAGVLNEHLSDAEYEAVFSGNFKRLWNGNSG